MNYGENAETTTPMPPAMRETLVCPFCAFQPSEGEYELLLVCHPFIKPDAVAEAHKCLQHVETNHAEGPSPFIASGQPVACPHSDCGEMVAKDELDYHLQMHGLEGIQDAPVASEDDRPLEAHKATEPTKSASRASSTAPSKARKAAPSKSHVAQAWRALFAKSKLDSKDERRRAHRKSENTNGEAKSHSRTEQNGRDPETLLKTSARLGKSELGRFAHEQEMPAWLGSMLRRDGQACNDGILPVLHQLLERSPSTSYAYLCHPHVHHVSKLRREGGFCGYRNIQMLVSHIIAAQATGSERFGPQFPTIFQIQDIIENAWDMGINSQGRIETGGIKGTRKYIGTPEAQAFFRSLDIPCWVQAFKDKDHGHAGSLLLRAIEDYFQEGWNVEDEPRVRLTSLAPIYFQHRGHSLTIIGLERLVSGQTQLLVFDPTFRDSHAIKQLIGREFQPRSSMVDATLEPYRRGKQYLKTYGEFELLYLGSRNTVVESA